ncbi:hypothetical protein EON83_30260 [bacterium]|nr:MAG: hypothetical protein EON83_30260 [bacterium]
MPYTYKQPYSLDGTQGQTINVYASTDLVTPLTTFTSDTNGRGEVTLTVSDSAATTLYLVRASDSKRLAVTTIDPREIASLWTTTTATAVWSSTTRSLTTFGTLAADIWNNSTRTLSAFGFTVNTNANSVESAIKAKTDLLPAAPASTTDIPTTTAITSAVWASATRTLSAFGFTVNTNANSVESAIKTKTDALPTQPAATSDIPSASTIATAVWNNTTRTITSWGTLITDIWNYATRSLSSADKEDIAVRVESHLLDEGDSQMLINAIVGAIGNTNINQTALVAAIRSDIERGGGTLATIAADYARRTGDYATATSITTLGTQLGNAISNLNNLSPSQAQAAALAALTAYDPPTRLEATTDKNEILAAIPTEIGGGNGGTPVLLPGSSVLFNPRFQSASNQGIPLALVEIYQANTRIGTGTTNASGRVEFAAGEGFILLKNTSYSVRVYAQGYQSHAPISVTLATDASPTYSLVTTPPFPISPDPQKAIVRVRTADFAGVPLQNETVTLTLDDQRPIAIGDKFISTRTIKGQTNEQGEVDLEVWSDETLLAAGLKPIYDLKMTGVTSFPIQVPPEGGIASHLKPTS